MRLCGLFFLNVLDLGTWGHSVSIVLGSHRGQQHGPTPRKLRCLAWIFFSSAGSFSVLCLVKYSWDGGNGAAANSCFALACVSGCGNAKTTIAKHFLFGMGTIMYVMLTFTPIWHSVWHKSVSCVSRPCGFTCGSRHFCSNRRSGHAIKKAKQFLAKFTYCLKR